MTNVITTIRAFGVYLLIIGLILIGYPHFLGVLLNIPLEAEPWLRPLGVALLALSYYYFRAALANNREFFGWSVEVRVGQFMLFILITSLGLLSPLILIVSGFEFATAVWTWFALKELDHTQQEDHV